MSISVDRKALRIRLSSSESDAAAADDDDNRIESNKPIHASAAAMQPHQRQSESSTVLPARKVNRFERNSSSSDDDDDNDDNDDRNHKTTAAAADRKTGVVKKQEAADGTTTDDSSSSSQVRLNRQSQQRASPSSSSTGTHGSKSKKKKASSSVHLGGGGCDKPAANKWKSEQCESPPMSTSRPCSSASANATERSTSERHRRTAAPSAAAAKMQSRSDERTAETVVTEAARERRRAANSKHANDTLNSPRPRVVERHSERTPKERSAQTSNSHDATASRTRQRRDDETTRRRASPNASPDDQGRFAAQRLAQPNRPSSGTMRKSRRKLLVSTSSSSSASSSASSSCTSPRSHERPVSQSRSRSRCSSSSSSSSSTSTSKSAERLQQGRQRPRLDLRRSSVQKNDNNHRNSDRTEDEEDNKTRPPIRVKIERKPPIDKSRWNKQHDKRVGGSSNGGGGGGGDSRAGNDNEDDDHDDQQNSSDAETIAKSEDDKSEEDNASFQRTSSRNRGKRGRLAANQSSAHSRSHCHHHQQHQLHHSLNETYDMQAINSSGSGNEMTDVSPLSSPHKSHLQSSIRQHQQQQQQQQKQQQEYRQQHRSKKSTDNYDDKTSYFVGSEKNSSQSKIARQNSIKQSRLTRPLSGSEANYYSSSKDPLLDMNVFYKTLHSVGDLSKRIDTAVDDLMLHKASSHSHAQQSHAVKSRRRMINEDPASTHHNTSFISKADIGDKLMTKLSRSTPLSDQSASASRHSLRTTTVRAIDNQSPGARAASGSAGGVRVFRLTSSALNRQREQQRIERDNQLILKRLLDVKPSKLLGKDEQIKAWEKTGGGTRVGLNSSASHSRLGAASFIASQSSFASNGTASRVSSAKSCKSTFSLNNLDSSELLKRAASAIRQRPEWNDRW